MLCIHLIYKNSRLPIPKHQTPVTGSPAFEFSGLETSLSKIFMTSRHLLHFFSK